MKKSLLIIASAFSFLAGTAMSVGGLQAQAIQTLPTSLKPHYTFKRFPGTVGEARAALATAALGSTIPMSVISFSASKDDKFYGDLLVGQSPFDTPLTTTHVNVLVVPVVVGIGAQVFSPVAVNNCGGSLGRADLTNLLASPIFKPVNFDGVAGFGHAATVNGVAMGLGTYIDQHRRSEFLKIIGGAASPYHTVFDVTVAPTKTIPASVTAGHSALITGTGCSLLGGLEFNFLDDYVVKTLLPSVAANPATFVILLMHNVVFYDNTPANCCILGYHGVLGNLQTYSPMDYDTTGVFANTTDISVAAHEVAEWLDDPLGFNPTPDWGNIGQVSGCQNNFEVGDPLSGKLFPAITKASGVTYHAQETAFWSWFYSADLDPTFNIGAGGKYSMNGTFLGPSKVCPPGGTFPN
jgi:hypothetical protein